MEMEYGYTQFVQVRRTGEFGYIKKVMSNDDTVALRVTDEAKGTSEIQKVTFDRPIRYIVEIGCPEVAEPRWIGPLNERDIKRISHSWGYYNAIAKVAPKYGGSYLMYRLQMFLMMTKCRAANRDGDCNLLECPLNTRPRCATFRLIERMEKIYGYCI